MSGTTTHAPLYINAPSEKHPHFKDVVHSLTLSPPIFPLPKIFHPEIISFLLCHTYCSTLWTMKTSLAKLAQVRVKTAVENGKLFKPDFCQWCERPSSMLHAHHRDYEKPLEIIWLCPPCHAKIHGHIGNVISSNLREIKQKPMTDEVLIKINYFRSTSAERNLWEAVSKKVGIRFSEFMRQAANEKSSRTCEGNG